jgi:hypothetical protein
MHKNKIDQKRKGIWAGVLLGASMLCMSSLGQATALNLDLEVAPDILSTFTTTSYTAGTQTFLADGFASQLFTNPTTYAITDSGEFDLDAQIDNFGNLVGGTLIITGKVSDLMFDSGTMLTGDLTAVGYADDVMANGDTIEFLFTVSGGDAAMMFGGIGAIGGVILGNTKYAGTWAADFMSDAFQVLNDTGVPKQVSAPTTVLMFSVALAGLAGFARKKQK